MKKLLQVALSAVFAAALAACGGGGSDGTDPIAVTLPSITASPVSQSVTSGSTASFSVTASGGSLSYQWQLDGVDIANATSATYTTPVVTVADSGGRYRVVVTNAAGSATSATATLTVSEVASGLSDNLSTATTLANEAFAVIDAAQRKSELPGGVQLLGLPAGVATTYPCSAGGSYTINFPDVFNANTEYSAIYDQCQWVSGYALDGSYVIRYGSFSDPSNFSWTATYDIDYTGPGGFNYTYAGTQTCSYVQGVASCTYNDGVRTFSSDFTYSGGQVNGAYSWDYGSVSLTYDCTGWTSTSGTITVTASNGFTATIVRTGANTFVVTINGGTAWTVTITS